MLEGVRRRSRSRRDTELAEDVLQMAGHGVLADDQRGRDLAVRPPGRHQPEHLDFTSGEPLVRAVAPGQRVDPRLVGLGAELMRTSPERCPARARQCRGRRPPGTPGRSGPWLGPPRRGLPDAATSPARVAARSTPPAAPGAPPAAHPWHKPPSPRRRHHGGRDRLEFVHRAPGPGQLADREGDLHVSGQQADATQRLGRLAGGAPDRGGGGVRVALTSRSRARPGWGSSPSAFASRKDRSAAAKSPARRCSSPCT